MKIYKNFEEIDEDLEVLKLKRNIHWEELKLTKNQFREEIHPFGWLSSFGKYFAKYGFFYLIRKFFK